MLGLQPSRNNINRLSVLAVFVAAAGLLSCSDDIENSEACLWETNDLLSHVGAPVSDLSDCGVLLGQQPLDNDCFRNKLQAGLPVQITINNCIDCMIHSTYVSTADASKFHLYREADYYGDDVRVVRVDSCTDFDTGQGSGANCVAPMMLYACSDPLPDPSDL